LLSDVFDEEDEEDSGDECDEEEVDDDGVDCKSKLLLLLLTDDMRPN
jgi:hypothetical protein